MILARFMVIAISVPLLTASLKAQDTIKRDTSSTLIPNWQVDVLAEEFVRSQSLKKDTASMGKIIHWQTGVIDGKNSLLKSDSVLMMVKDSTSEFWKKAFTTESKQHYKTKDKLDRSILLNKLLGVTVITLGVVLALVL